MADDQVDRVVREGFQRAFRDVKKRADVRRSPYRDAQRALRRRMVEVALEVTGGGYGRVASLLGMSKSQVKYLATGGDR